MYVRVRGKWNRMAKAPGVESYQNDVALICRTARPSGWNPSKRVRTRFWFYLKRDADCDNLLKVIHDAIAEALGVNDKAFLPFVVAKETGLKEPWTEIEIENIES